MTVRLIDLPPCDEPRLFARAPEVCANCGNLIAAHCTPAEADATLRAMWKIMIAFGGVYNRYDGAPDKQAGDVLRTHMSTCAVDFRHTVAPTMDGLSKFTDSVTEADPVTMLNGDLYCLCGEYNWEHVCIDGMSLGQLIWQVAHLDDEPAPLQIEGKEQTP